MQIFDTARIGKEHKYKIREATAELEAFELFPRDLLISQDLISVIKIWFQDIWKDNIFCIRIYIQFNYVP